MHHHHEITSYCGTVPKEVPDTLNNVGYELREVSVTAERQKTI